MATGIFANTRKAVKGTEAAVVAMECHCFRVGAIRTLTIRAGRFAGESKGKEISGVSSPMVIVVQ